MLDLRRNGDPAKDQVGNKARSGAEVLGKLAEVAAGDEDLRRLREVGSQSVDNLANGADGAPKEAAFDGGLRILAEDGRRLSARLQQRERQKVSPGRECFGGKFE